MDEWDSVDDGIDWLTGEYTYKKEKIRKALKEGRGMDIF
jgi:hypothetical protein